MSRKPNPTATAPAIIDTTAVDQLSHSANALVAMDAQQNALVRATAAKLGYQLPADATDPDLIQRDIAANMRRSVEACLEVGRGLAVLKAACPHGQYMPRLEVLGLDVHVAARFMQAAAKFSKLPSTATLTKAIGNQTKLFEMLVLDDEQIDELANFGQTGELSLDDVATMSVKELRSALREERQERQSGEEARQRQAERIDKLERENARIAKFTPDQKLAQAKKEAVSHYADAQGLIVGQLRQSLKALAEHGAEVVYMAGLVGQLQSDLRNMAAEFNLPDVSNAVDQALAAEVSQWAKA